MANNSTKYKILVVDDEPFIARSIKRMIEMVDGWEVVDIAINGQDALTKYGEQQPDVVFSDVRMPVMDGLALLRALSARTEPPLMVVLSGYGEFEYARQALKAGVFDYLLKPVTPDALQDLLRRVRVQLSERRDSRSRRVLRELVSNPSFVPSEGVLHRCFPWKRYGVMLMVAGPCHQFSGRPIPDFTDLWETYALDQCLCRAHQLPTWSLEGVYPNERIFVFGAAEGEDLTPAMKEIYELLCGGLVPITCVAGQFDGSIVQVGKNLPQYRRSLRRGIRFARSGFWKIDTPPQQISGPPPLTEEEKREWRMLLEQNKKEFVFQKIDARLERMRDQGMRQTDLHERLEEMLWLIAQALRLPETSIQDLRRDLTDMVNGCWECAVLKQDYSEMVQELFREAAESDLPQTARESADRIEAYIRAHYLEHLTVQQIARQFGFVAPYVSRIFKKEKGVTPSEMILSLRIEKIKELLLVDPPLPLKVIAENTGFNDPFYMSRAFKQATGENPSEYRNHF